MVTSYLLDLMDARTSAVVSAPLAFEAGAAIGCDHRRVPSRPSDSPQGAIA